MAQGTIKLLWLQFLLTELGFAVTNSSYLLCNNKFVIMLFYNSVLHERTKHIEVVFTSFEKKLITLLLLFVLSYLLL